MTESLSATGRRRVGRPLRVPPLDRQKTPSVGGSDSKLDTDHAMTAGNKVVSGDRGIGRGCANKVRSKNMSQDCPLPSILQGETLVAATQFSTAAWRRVVSAAWRPRDAGRARPPALVLGDRPLQRRAGLRILVRLWPLPLLVPGSIRAARTNSPWQN